MDLEISQAWLDAVLKGHGVTASLLLPTGCLLPGLWTGSYSACRIGATCPGGEGPVAQLDAWQLPGGSAGHPRITCLICIWMWQPCISRQRGRRGTQAVPYACPHALRMPAHTQLLLSKQQAFRGG